MFYIIADINKSCIKKNPRTINLGTIVFAKGKRYAQTFYLMFYLCNNISL